MKKTDFHINVKPISINFECHYCGWDAEILCNDLCVPEYWGYDWGAVLCPYCENEVELGDYDYD